MEQKQDEFYDGGDPEFDPNEFNRVAASQKFNVPYLNQNIDKINVTPSTAYDKLKEAYDTEAIQFVVPENLSSKTTTVALEEMNPINKFLKIKAEIDQIEKDIEYYKEHKDIFKGEVPLEKCMDELNKLKKLSEFISKSDNYSKLKKILELQQQNNTNFEAEKYYIFNKQMYEKLNESLLKRLEIINKLKADNPASFKNIEYQLFISPDTEKVKQFSKLTEIKQTLKSIESKIGDWNYEANKKTIANVVETIKNHLRLFDNDFQKEIRSKLEALTKRIDEIIGGKENFYSTVKDEKLQELYSGFDSSKDVEDLIFNTISKMENLKNNHEESAFISLKIKELIF